MVVEAADADMASDPFRWLEDGGAAAVIDWQLRSNAQTVAELAASPHAPTVAAAVRATFVDLFSATAPERFGDHWFRKAQPAGQANIVIEVSASPTRRGRILFDPRQDGDTATIAGCYPSPSGERLLVLVDIEGRHVFRVLNVADGAVIRSLDIAQACLCAWSPDDDGFYYHQLGTRDVDGQPVPAMEIWWQPLAGEAERQDLEIDHPFAWPVAASNGRWVAINADQTALRPRWIRRTGSEAWTRFLPGATAMYKGTFVGDEYWAISNDRSGWCRVVAIPLGSAEDRASWRELVPDAPGHKLMAITRCGDHVALAVIEDGVMRMKSLDADGRDLGYVPLPGDGAFGLFGMGYIAAITNDILGPDGDGCTLVHSSLDRSPGVYRADLADLSIAELEAPAHILSDREVSSHVADGPQGPVRYWIMRRAATPLDGSAAAIVTGYGGFNVPEIPHYTPMAAAWTKLGGIWVHAQLRGGGERDTAFWHAGRMHRKQGTFDDFFAVIEDLHARGVTTPRRTGIWGTSNGGLLVGAAVSQRPELLGAAVAQVPILDLVNFGRDPVTVNIAKADYGDLDKPEDAAAMRGYSPYHRVRAGTAYPALLCDAGANDLSCPPWHSRKMVAAVEAASTSGRRIRLRVRESAGHNQMTAELFIQRDIEELTFFHDELMHEREDSPVDHAPDATAA